MLAEAYIKAGGDTFYLCDIKDGQHEAVAEIVFNARGGGLSVNEFQDLPALVKDMKSWTIFTVTRIRDGSIVAMVSYKRSPLVRSECPIYYSEYIVLIPEVRKIHLSRRIIEAVEHVYETLGYRGSLSRTATSATVPVINGILSKWYSTGVIPNSVYLPKLGWVEDLVFFSSKDSEKDKDIPMPEDYLVLPHLRIMEPIPGWLCSPISPKPFFPDLECAGNKWSVTCPVDKDLWTVEEMVRDAATNGQGFAIDEFSPEGYFNRRLLYRGHVLIVKSEKGDVVAAVIFGPSRCCRETHTRQVGGYIIVEKSWRYQGIGSAFLDYCVRHRQKLGYSAILTDVFTTNKCMLNMLMQRGFIVTATFPNSGYIIGSGRTDAMLFYKHDTKIKHSRL